MALTRNEKKIIRLNEELERLTQRIKEDTMRRAAIEKEISQLESEALSSFLKTNNIPINEELFKNLAITKRIVDNGYTADDLEQLFGVDNKSITEEAVNEKK